MNRELERCILALLISKNNIYISDKIFTAILVYVCYFSPQEKSNNIK